MSTAEEIEPYLVCRVIDGELECATWTLESGQRALALFLSNDSAKAYLATARLPEPWRTFQPQRNDLVTILKQCQQTEIAFAVLDPDGATAKRIFDLNAVIQNLEGPS